MERTKKYTLKIIIIGEPAVGKTSLVKKFISGQFSKDYRSSIGTNIFAKKIKLENDIDTSLQLWDIAGQERWTNMRHLYYAGAKGVIIVGDLTRRSTFDQIERFWVPDVNKYCNLAPILLLANKCDLESQISNSEIISVGERINALSIFNTSAKTGENVESAFKIISKKAIKIYY
ncbi:MAG: Rab family GTPase [Candidatus Hermodarchaeota archaeon]